MSCKCAFSITIINTHKNYISDYEFLNCFYFRLIARSYWIDKGKIIKGENGKVVCFR